MAKGTEPVRVLFVCLGNICRSPLAEGVFSDLVEQTGRSEQIDIDSAGTGAWHVGNPPDRRMRETAARHGVSLDGQHARRFTGADLESFDHIYAMDEENLRDILKLDPTGEHSEKVCLFRDFDPTGAGGVPDPYYGGAGGFEEVFQIVDRTSKEILAALIDEHDL